jgi:hypothetical protein
MCRTSPTTLRHSPSSSREAPPVSPPLTKPPWGTRQTWLGSFD